MADEAIQVAFGRLEAPDVRDLGFPMSAALEAEPLPPYKFWSCRTVLNQLKTSACVGASWRTLLEAAPSMVRIGDGPTWETLYRESQRADDFPGEEPQMQGSSVRAGAKVLQSLGILATYVWAQNIADVRAFVLQQGPVVVGTNWYAQMSNPDSTGRIRIGGGVVGGHAYCICGYTSRTRCFRLQNSWGRSFGVNGKANIHEDDLARLIGERGEACAPTEKAI